MAKPDRKSGFAVNGGKTQKSRGKFKKIMCIVAVLIIVIVIATTIYAVLTGTVSTWLNTYADIFILIGGAVFTGDIIVFILSSNGDDKSNFKALVCIFAVSLLLLLIGGGLKLVAGVYEKPVHVEVETIRADLYQPVVSVTSVEVFEKKQYVRDDDPFFEDLELYLGMEKGTISSENAVYYMKDILVDDIIAEKLKAEKEKTEQEEQQAGGLPQIYVEATALAEAQHDTYVKQRFRDWEREEAFADILQGHRLDDLESAIDYRKTANEAYEDSGNMRLIAVYYKEAGDEYIKKSLLCAASGDVYSKEEAEKMAQQYFEEGAQWCMKAVYCTVKKEDSQKVKEVMDTFYDIKNEADAEKIETLYIAYTLAVKGLE